MQPNAVAAPTTVKRSSPWAPWLPLLPALFALIVFFVIPLVAMVRLSFQESTNVAVAGGWSLRHYVYIFTSDLYREIIWKSLGIGLLTTFITLIIGFPLANYYVHASPRYKGLMLFIIIAPLLINMVVRTYGWQIILGRTGFLNELLRLLGWINEPLALVYNFTGVVIGMTHVFLPFMVLSLSSALQSIDRRIYEGAEILGATDWQRFWTITLPLSRPGIIAGCILVFSLTQGAFVTPLMLGGTVGRTIASLVHIDTLVRFNWPRATAMANVLMLIIVAVLLLQVRLLKGHSSALGGSA